MLPISASTSTTGAAPPKMRMVSSCNGCRALRKRCSHDCTIRPCLQWIESGPEAQGNATVFLAKFYGRAGLLNLIAAAPDADDAADGGRPAVFRSMLYEACGRIVNPAYGAVGLLWSGQWQKCVDAVQAVFKGDLSLVAPVDSVRAAQGNVAASSSSFDIRHFAKDPDAAAAADLLRFARGAGGRTRGRKKGFKRAAGSSSDASMAKLVKGKGKATKNVALGQQQEAAEEVEEPVPMVMELLEHDGGHGHGHHLKGKGLMEENTDVEAASDVIQAEAEPPVGRRQVLAADHQDAEEVVGLGLELTLGFQPVPVVRQQPGSPSGDQTGSSGLRLQLPA